MHETTPKQEWVAPRIVALDDAENTAAGVAPGPFETVLMPGDPSSFPVFYDPTVS